MTQVFVANAQRDASLVTRILREFQELGISSFHAARDIRPGDDFRRSIMAAIKRADAFVLVIGSVSGAQSSWAPYEAGMADALRKPVVVLVSHVVPLHEVPAELRQSRIVTFDPADPARAVRSLVDWFREAA